jgi:holo-[acyl-carrier protein] synthase
LSAELQGIGVALVSVPRFEQALQRFGERFLERIFSPAEIAYTRRKRYGTQNLAARFAAKCAGRALLRSHCARGLRLRDFEVERRPSGEPTLVLHRAAREAEATSALRFSLSLSHDAELALASLWALRGLRPGP